MMPYSIGEQKGEFAKTLIVFLVRVGLFDGEAVTFRYISKNRIPTLNQY
jgi:hypothetical protein